jgi:hypothetical protein
VSSEIGSYDSFDALLDLCDGEVHEPPVCFLVASVSFCGGDYIIWSCAESFWCVAAAAKGYM